VAHRTASFDKGHKTQRQMKNSFKKTYGVEGLIDWQANIKAGKATLVITFTGGGLTSYGVTPAQYTTENALYQRIIENSKEFASGRIKLIRSTKIEEPEKGHSAVTDMDAVEKVVPKVKKQEVLSVYNCSDARIWLKEHKNISVVGKSKADIIEIAAANGVSFPNLFK